jgi:hypothetical protein
VSVKRRAKRLITLLLLVGAATAGYQVWEFMSHYNRVKDVTYHLLAEYDRIGRDTFVRELELELSRLDVELKKPGITVREDESKRTVRVEFRYTRELRILFLSFEREMYVWRSIRDVDVAG